MIYNKDNMKTVFEKYVDDCVKVLEKHTESLGVPACLLYTSDAADE